MEFGPPALLVLSLVASRTARTNHGLVSVVTTALSLLPLPSQTRPPPFFFRQSVFRPLHVAGKPPSPIIVGPLRITMSTGGSLHHQPVTG